jgi:hypothetical protein
MFFPGSRYIREETYTVRLPNGAEVRATTLPLSHSRALLGYHPRLEGQRLDHIANRFLADPTASWQLCEANGTIAPDALAARALVAIPQKDR